MPRTVGHDECGLGFETSGRKEWLKERSADNGEARGRNGWGQTYCGLQPATEMALEIRITRGNARSLTRFGFFRVVDDIKVNLSSLYSYSNHGVLFSGFFM